MKKIIIIFLLVLTACASRVEAPTGFEYREITTKPYLLASWQKISNPNAPVRVYIEGDGYAFNHNGQPTSNPTPKGHFMRDLAFNDPNPNVVYLARPCQYVEDEQCSYSNFAWTTGRFSKAVVDSMSSAVEQVSQGKPVILIGYSGGAMISGLMIGRNPNMDVKKWITIAGVLNHGAWTGYHKVRPLIDSLEMNSIPNVAQIHFAGEKDTVVPPELIQSAAPRNSVYIVSSATHNTGFEGIKSFIYQ